MMVCWAGKKEERDMQTRFQILVGLIYAFIGALFLLLILVTSSYLTIAGMGIVFLLSWTLARKYDVHRATWDLSLVAPGLIAIAYVWLIRPTSCMLVAVRFLGPVLLALYLASLLGGRMGVSKRQTEKG